MTRDWYGAKEGARIVGSLTEGLVEFEGSGADCKIAIKYALRYLQKERRHGASHPDD